MFRSRAFWSRARQSTKDLLVLRHVAPRPRYNSTGASIPPNKEPPRVNPVGIQYLSQDLRSKVFPTSPPDQPDPDMLRVSMAHLDNNGLLGKSTQISDPIVIRNFPELVGKNSLDEHFHKLAADQAQPYLSMAETFLSAKSKIPKMPSNWCFQAGWTRYEQGKAPEAVPFPLEDEIVFDVEVLYQLSHYSVLATAVTKNAWYGWVSPFLEKYAENPLETDMEYLIPFNTLKDPKLMIGYNVGYDRARVLEEYSIQQSKAFYLDAMSLHIATTGITTQQRGKWMNYKKTKDGLELQEEPCSEHEEYDAVENAKTVERDLQDDPWLAKSSTNSLALVAEHHCKIKLKKADREAFSTLNPQEIIDDFQNLMTYCAKDVDATFQVSRKIFPEFRKKVPHPVSFAALKNLGSLFLPSTKKWDGYIETAEGVYQKNKSVMMEKLKYQINKIVEDMDEVDHQNDPWLSQLDWTIKEPRLNKNGEQTKRQAYMVGFPEWYRELFKALPGVGGEREMNILNKTRIIPILLRLSWEGYPLFWTDKSGWCFKVPSDDTLIESLEAKNYKKIIPGDEDEYLHELQTPEMHYTLFKIPHPNGPSKRTTIVMGKNFLQYFDSGILSSEYDYAIEIMKLNSLSSYWVGNRKRIQEQFIVYNDMNQEKNEFFRNLPENEDLIKDNKDMGIIIPKICPMGTITRRATENTWLTASNSKKNRIGSELKAMIEAPKGYTFVGADVDSEELWIAALIGDSVFKMHGATALGWMTLEGNKNEKTDLHSKTAGILGISRGDAKVFNYGRIYGAGVKFAVQLLTQFNPDISESQALETAKKLYLKTKGDSKYSKIVGRKLHFGGSESIMFNKLESIAYEENPRTPVLGAAITGALKKQNLKKNQYLTSRVNWSIQSSGVDYLHLVIISMQHLSERYNVPLRLSITFHDELRYLCKKEDQYKVALLLQISNLWTRAMFCQELGMNEVPQSCAFFSEVDIDHVLRKEVGMDCITPSHPEAIPPGESLDILKLLDVCENGKVLKEDKNMLKRYDNIPYQKRVSVLQSTETYGKPEVLAFTELQCSTTAKEWLQNLKKLQNAKVFSEGSEPENVKWLLPKLMAKLLSKQLPKLSTKQLSAKKVKKFEEYDLEQKDAKEALRRYNELNGSIDSVNSKRRNTQNKKDVSKRINSKMKSESVGEVSSISKAKDRSNPALSRLTNLYDQKSSNSAISDAEPAHPRLTPGLSSSPSTPQIRLQRYLLTNTKV